MAQVNWTIKGKLKVRTQFPEVAAAFGDGNGDVPLEGVRVKISAKESKLDVSGFQEWGQAVTKADGSFQITKTKDKSGRFFRIEALFENDQLKLYPGTLVKLGGGQLEDQLSSYLFKVDWMKVWEDDEKKGPGTVDFRNLTFCAVAGEELDGRDQRRQADIWFMTFKLMSFLDSLGPGLGFTEPGPFGIKYPHDDPNVKDDVEEAFADPIRRVVFFIRNSRLDSFDLQTVMHELMHMRNYQHSTGEIGLAWELAIHGTTHDGRQDVTWTAFHEASAETWKTEAYRQLFGKGATVYRGGFAAERRPYTRAHLKSLGIKSLNEVQHFEHGWMSTFNLLLLPKTCVA